MKVRVQQRQTEKEKNMLHLGSYEENMVYMTLCGKIALVKVEETAVCRAGVEEGRLERRKGGKEGRNERSCEGRKNGGNKGGNTSSSLIPSTGLLWRHKIDHSQINVTQKKKSQMYLRTVSRAPMYSINITWKCLHKIVIHVTETLRASVPAAHPLLCFALLCSALPGPVLPSLASPCLSKS